MTATNDNDNNILFSFKCPKYEWNIEYDKNSTIISEKIYPVSISVVNLKANLYYHSSYGDKMFGVSCIPKNYFITYSHRQTKSTPKLVEYSEYVTPILSYDFMGPVSLYMYCLFNEFNICKSSDKILVISKDYYVLDAIICYLTYVLFTDLIGQTSFFLYDDGSINENTIRYASDHKIVPTIIHGLDNDSIKKNASKIDNIDICICDLSVISPNSNLEKMNLTGGYSFQLILSSIILSLQKLNKGGTLIINTFLITNDLAFKFYTYLSDHFESNFIYEPSDAEMRPTEQILSAVSFVVYKNYNKTVSEEHMKKLFETNHLNHMYDSSGGLGYEVTDSEISKLFLLDSRIDTDRSDPKPQSYLKSMFDMNIDDTIYERYRSYLKLKMIDIVNFYTLSYTTFTNRENKDYVKKYCQVSYDKALYLAKKYNLPIAAWINQDQKSYIDQTISKYIKNISFSRTEKFNFVEMDDKVNVYYTLDAPYHSNLKKNFELNELAYQYTEKININKYKAIELIINSGQKELNKRLYTNYNININRKSVSRAWIKMYELLFDTNFFNNLSEHKVVSGFHICEAPGNFINSILYYLKYNTDIQKYDWTAQSLAAGYADFYDSYGFIKQTQKQWDLGPKKTGDITDYENFVYYHKTYGSKINILVSDCGEKWGIETGITHNLQIFQMIYAILFPKENGNFIIKSYSVNYNKIYLSLLYLACNIYETVYAFKSNTNFWSPEIYIVGINKRKLTSIESDSLIKIAKNTTQNIHSYPFDHLPDNFCKQYEKIMYEYIAVYTDIKIFFVFLSKNDTLLKENKGKISKIIDDKNKEWGRKYIENKKFIS